MSQPSQAPAVPTITSKNLPASPPAPSGPGVMGVNPLAPVAAPVPDSQIVAKRLSPPAIDRVVSKNPELSFRWVNRVSGEGLRFSQMEAIGFRVATVNDCSVTGMTPKDGKFMNMDVILMCMPRVDYVGATNANAVEAQRRVARAGVKARGNTELHQALNEVPAPNAMRSKISTFVPTEEEAEKLGS